MTPIQNYLAAAAGWKGGKPVYASVCPSNEVNALHLATFPGLAHGRDVYEVAESLCATDVGTIVTGLYVGRAHGRDVYVGYRCPCITSSSGVSGCACMETLRNLGWPNLLVTFRGSDDIGCPDCLPQERIYYFNGPPGGQVGSGFYQDPEPGEPAIPPDCDPTGTLLGKLDCGQDKPLHCTPDCPVEGAGAERWMSSFNCNANATASEGCFAGPLESISCEPFLLRGTKLCCPDGTLSGCCGEPDFGGQGPPGCIDVEVTLAP